MKKIIFFLSLIMVSMAIYAFGFSEKASKPALQYMWFDFNGTSSAQYTDLSKYSQDPNHLNPCSGAGLRCEIYAPVIETGPNAGKPDILNIAAETKKP